MEATVTIKGRNPHRSIEMSMEEYIGFIRGQAYLLGLTEEEDLPIYLVGFDEGLSCGDCTVCNREVIK